MNGLMRSNRWLSLFALVLLALSGRAALAAQTVLTYVSEPDDYVGQGQEATFTPADGQFSIAPAFNGLTVSFIAPNFTHFWTLTFGAADGQVLVPGSYENAERFVVKSPGHPGLDFSGDSRGCNLLTGRFDLLELVRNSAGEAVSLAINFEQHCEGATAALFGQIRINSDVALAPKPLHISLVNPLNSRNCVEATSPKGAQVDLLANEAHDAQGGQQLQYSWTASSGASGSSPEFKFQAPLGPAPTNVALTVLDLTNNTTRSATKSVCVADTVAPKVTILRPTPGALVHDDDVVLEVLIVDAVDKNITSYEADLGVHVVSPLNPHTGRSRQRLQEAPRSDGPVPTTITVRAHDASGNANIQTVNFSEVFNLHGPRR